MNAPPPLPKEDDEGSFSMLIAGGPFTPDVDLQYRPWQNLAQVISKESPDTVMLVRAGLPRTYAGTLILN